MHIFWQAMVGKAQIEFVNSAGEAMTPTEPRWKPQISLGLRDRSNSSNLKMCQVPNKEPMFTCQIPGKKPGSEWSKQESHVCSKTSH